MASVSRRHFLGVEEKKEGRREGALKNARKEGEEAGESAPCCHATDSEGEGGLRVFLPAKSGVWKKSGRKYFSAMNSARK